MHSPSSLWEDDNSPGEKSSMVPSCLRSLSSRSCSCLFKQQHTEIHVPQATKICCWDSHSQAPAFALPAPSLPGHCTSLFTIACSQAVLKDSNPAAICINLDTKGIALFYLSTWFLVATTSIQGASFELTKLQMQFNSDSLGEEKTPAEIHNCCCPLHRPRWVRCELPPCPAN